LSGLSNITAIVIFLNSYTIHGDWLYNSSMRSLSVCLCLTLLPFSALAQADRKVTKADVDRWMTELSNWGRWGKDDQMGALNFITPATRKEAARQVKEGYSVSLEHDVLTERTPENPAPYTITWTARGPQFASDTINVSYHGYAHSHMDSLCHMANDHKIFNGFSDEIVPKAGCANDAILTARNGILARGVLIDIPKLKGVEFMEPGTAVYPEDLQAWEKKTGVKISRGDVVFIRTGRWARWAAKGPWNLGRNAAGLDASCAKWLHDREIAMLGSDGVSDVLPSPVEGVVQPIHQLTLVALGIRLFDNCDLEALSQAASERKRWTFMLTAAPLAIHGGTGSPLNPIATF
jgi:kynurenine formamidase